MYKQFQFSQTAIEQTLRDLRSGASNDFVEQFFADDPEMLAWIHQQNQTNGRTDSIQASTSEELAAQA